MSEEKVIVAFNRNFGQLDILELSKTGLSTAGKLLTDNPVIKSMISQTSQAISVAGGASIFNILGSMALITFITSWITDALSDRPGPVDNPIYVNIYNSGVERADKLKSWGLTDREIHDLAFKIGFIPMISLTGRIIRVQGGYIGSRPTEMFPETYNSKDGSVEIVDPDSWIVTGIYAPAEKKYMEANIALYMGISEDLIEVPEGGGIPVTVVAYTGLPWGIPPSNINEPIPKSVTDKINNAASREASGSQVIPEGIATPSGLVIPNEILNKALQTQATQQAQQAGMSPIIMLALAGLALPLLFKGGGKHGRIHK